jgi:hypothetical protein
MRIFRPGASLALTAGHPPERRPEGGYAGDAVRATRSDSGSASATRAASADRTYLPSRTSNSAFSMNAGAALAS